VRRGEETGDGSRSSTLRYNPPPSSGPSPQPLQELCFISLVQDFADSLRVEGGTVCEDSLMRHIQTCSIHVEKFG
jgi:hypothetical protein